MSVQNDHLRRSDGLWCSTRRVIYQSLAGRFFGRAGAVRVHLDGCAIQTKTVNGYADHVMFLKRIKQPVQNTRVGPTAHPGVDRVPFAEPWRQGAPFAAILGNKEDGIDDSQVRNPHMSTLNWQVGLDQRILRICYLIHNKYLAQRSTK